MKIRLDHAKSGHAAPFWVQGLLLSALVFVSAAGWEYFQLESERANLQMRLQNDSRANRIPSNTPPPSPETQRVLQEQVRQANTVLSELGRPWPALFSVLEATARPEIALLVIRPDAAKGRLRIAGEARQLADALDYTRKLAASGHMTDVVLEEHEVVASEQQRPVRFALSARWAS
ncbi:MAG: PilN domain-containing protein [Nitrosospira sp.]